MSDIKNFKRQLENRLHALYLRQVLLGTAEAILRSLFYSVILISFFVLLETAWRFSSEIRTAIWFLFWISAAMLFLFFLFRILISKYHIHKGPDYSELSEMIGAAFPEIKDELKNAYQIVSAKAPGVSDELVNAAFKSAYEKTIGLNFNGTLSTDNIKSALKQNYISLMLIAVIAIYPPLNYSVKRLVEYEKEFIVPAKYSFDIKPGNLKVTKGNSIDISVKLIGGSAEELNLFVKSQEDYDFKNIVLRKDSNDVFHFVKSSLQSSIEYYAEYDGVKSDKFIIETIDRPIITELSFHLTPPAYTGLSGTVQKDNGNIIALPGTKLELTLAASKPLSEAKIVWSDSSVTNMKANNAHAGIDVNLNGDKEYYIQITDTSGINSIDPLVYSIKMLEDSNPFIELLIPQKDVTLGEIDIISLLAKISDDYGFSALKLNYKLSQSNYKQIDSVYKAVSIPVNKKEKEQEAHYSWDLSSLSLAENDVVSFYLEVFDNDNVNGPKSARTKILNVRVPTLDELFAMADNTHEESVSDLEETFEEAKKLKEELTKLSNELKKDDKKVEWEEKEKIESALEKMKSLEKKISEISENIKKMQNELRKNNLLSPETLEKYNELQKLFEQLNSDEMKKALEQMQNMLSKLNRDKIQQSMENLQFNEEMFQKSLERTINLLKRIQVEQKLDEVLKRTEEILNKQKELQEKTEDGSLNEKEKEQLAEQQEELKKNLDKLQKEMEKLSEKMSELDDMPNEMMDDIQDEFEKQNNQELSEEAKEKMEKGDFKSAAQMQKQLTANMQSMKQKLSEMKSQMKMQNQVKTMAEMMQIINELLDLSKEQEALKNKTNGLGSDSPTLGENARRQNEKISSLNKIVSKMLDLSQKTFAITPEMGKALGMARIEMSQAISSLQNRNSSMGVKHQTGAMKYLNEAAQQMQNAMANMMNPGQGGGMMSLMQQMQKLSQQQMSLNQMTKMMQKGELTMQQMAQMQRLAKEQQMIRKALEELNKEIEKSGSEKKITGNIRKIIDEMKEVISGLNTQKIEDNLILKQERILSRMLDAQRSINERDFEKNRESAAGKQFNLNSPPELLLQTEEGRNKLRDELLKAIREGYSKDYEELIRQYFRALEKASEKFKN